MQPLQPQVSTSEAWELLLLRLRYRGGSLTTVGSNQPILLDKPEMVYLLYSGVADIFAVDLLPDGSLGARAPMFRAAGSMLLPGMAIEGHQRGVLINGILGTQLLRIKLETLTTLAADEEFTDILTETLDNWITGISRGMTEGITPRHYMLLEAGRSVTLKPEEVARPKRQIVWVNRDTDTLQLMGKPDLRLPVPGTPFPLSDQTWICASTQTDIEVTTTEAVFKADPQWNFLTAFHATALACISTKVDSIRASDDNRVNMRLESDRSQFEGALSGLSSLLGYQRKSGLHMQADDTLMAACQMVGQAMGIDIKPVPPSAHSGMQNTLSNIARASRVRTRRVALTEDWWTTDSGPILAYRGEDKHAVALLPTSTHSYDLHDPTTGQRSKINTQIASELQPFGDVFYRSFAHQTLYAVDLLGFGLRGAGRDLLTVAAMGVGIGLLSIITPIVTGEIFDTVIPRADRNLWLQVVAVLILSAITTALFQLTRSIAVLRVESKLDATTQAAVWDRLLDLPTRFFRDYTAGDLGQRALGITTIRREISGPVVTAILAAFFAVFNLLLLFYFDSQMAIVATGLALLPVVVAVVVGRSLLGKQRQMIDIQGKLSGIVLQFINGINKFRVAGAESRAFARWAHEFKAQKGLAVKARKTQNLLVVFNAVYPLLTLIVIFALVGLSPDKQLTTGNFLAFITAFNQFLLASLALDVAVLTLITLSPVYERMKPILETLPEVSEAKIDPGELSGHVDVEHIVFRYRADGPRVLNDVSFSANPGEFVALVGPSGCGKSTLLRLMLGFETPEAGAVFYDGQDLSDLDLHGVRRQMGVVLQSSKLMMGDILTNIIGTTTLTVDDAWTAVRMAGLEEDITHMPMGLYTVIPEDGSTFSGGQRQRLLIARAIVNKPRILFFDEATSALDNKTQAIVSESLQNLDATRIVIAHRLSTIEQADRILVFDGGKIVQSGTYAELMREGGMFAKLARRQLA